PQTAVREFQVLRSGAGAEVGRTNAGFVNVVTKSGTNEFHGEAMYLRRDKVLTSRDAFDRKLDNRQNLFGGSLGGPLAADRAFFFVGVEQNLLRVPFLVQFLPQAAGTQAPGDLLALQGEKRGTNNPTALFARSDIRAKGPHSFNLQYTYTRMRGENFNFDLLQVNQAGTTNYTLEGESRSVKSSFVSVLSPAVVNEARAQAA